MTRRHNHLPLSIAIATLLAFPFAECHAGNDDDSMDVHHLSDTQIHFVGIAPPTTPAEKNRIRTTIQASVNGEAQNLRYSKLISVGEQNNHETFGLIKDYTDTPIVVDGKPLVCNGTDLPDFASDGGAGPDHLSLLQKNGRLYGITQFECSTGAMYFTELTQSASGQLSVRPNSMRFVSQSAGFGGWNHCAGVTTPWQSHLGSEEYEPNARVVLDTPDKRYASATRYFWKGEARNNNPYYYGWTPEVSIDQRGNPRYVKHFSMGRFSHELAYVMPDQKTVYLTDDGTNVGFFLFIADQAGDLSRGKLYSAKWTQTTDHTGTGVGEAILSWIDMGHSSDAIIHAKLNPDHDISTNDGIKFADIFAVETPIDGACPTAGSGLDGRFKSVNTSVGQECLRLNDMTGDGQIDMEDIALASRLETRRMAALLGATTEFRKEEGIAFNARDQKLYIAMSEISSGMESSTAKPANHLGGNDHVQVEKNVCGAVYQLSLGTDATMGSAFVAYNMKGLVAGKPLASGVGYANTALGSSYQTCDVDAIANPDNLTFVEGSNLLIIGEDGAYHPEDFVWAYDLTSQQLTRIASVISGAEATSPYWYNLKGKGYMTLTTQHPYGEAPYQVTGKNADKPLAIPADAQLASEIGYVGPIELRK